MRSDKLNWYGHGGYKEMTAPSSNIFVTNESKTKRCIVNKIWSQKYSVKENELCFTKKDESKCSNEKQKDAKNEVAYDVTNYLNVCNVFECGRDNPDAQYERACMANVDNDYFSDVLDILNKYRDRHGKILSSKKLSEAQ